MIKLAYLTEEAGVLVQYFSLLLTVIVSDCTGIPTRWSWITSSFRYVKECFQVFLHGVRNSKRKFVLNLLSVVKQWYVGLVPASLIFWRCKKRQADTVIDAPSDLKISVKTLFFR